MLPLDQVEAAGETWEVTAVLFYRDATSEWPVVKIGRGVDTAWIALEDGKIVRYDHLDLPVGADVSVGRFWPVDRMISKQNLNR